VISVARTPPAPWSERASSAFRANLRWSLPLLLLGVVALLVGAVAYAQAGHSPPMRFPLWGLAITIGVLALGGGLVALFAGDFSSESERGIVRLGAGEMVVPKGEWLELRKRVDLLSQRRTEDSSSWSEAEEAPVSVAFMPVSTPPKSGGRRQRRGSLFGRGPSSGGRGPPEPDVAPEPPAPPPAPLTDSSSRLAEPATPPAEKKPAPAADST
jgi:hypothetical protein